MLGQLQQSGCLQLPVQGHDEVGSGDVRDAGGGGGRGTGDDGPGGYQFEPADPAGEFVLPGLAAGGDVREAGSAGESGAPRSSMEPDDDAEAAETRFQREVQLGD